MLAPVRVGTVMGPAEVVKGWDWNIATPSDPVFKNWKTKRDGDVDGDGDGVGDGDGWQYRMCMHGLSHLCSLA